MKINWVSLSGAFHISHYIVKTSYNRIDIGDFVREDIKYNATVTGVDIADNIGEESVPVFFTLDSEYLQYICLKINYCIYLIYCIQSLSVPNNCHM